MSNESWHRPDYRWTDYDQWTHQNAIRPQRHQRHYNENQSFENPQHQQRFHDPYFAQRDFGLAQPRAHPYANSWIRRDLVPLNHSTNFTDTPNAGSYVSPSADLYSRQHAPALASHSNQYSNFSNPSLEPLLLDCDVSATKIDISWKPVSGRKDIRYIIYCTDKDGHSWTFDHPWTQTHRELKTSQGSTYCVKVECRTTRDNKVLASATKEIKAVFSYREQEKMYAKAVGFVGSNMHPFDILYRCKPKSYWDDIHFYRGDIMEKYMKDNNGQPANLINGVISGLFFSARLLNDGSLPPQSPFGNVRMMVKAQVLLNPELHNFYFADFYCNYLTHYVTIVICKKNSETDRYCYMRLVRMDMANNPFLKILPRRDAFYQPYNEFWATRGVWVELFFSEDVPLNWGRFDAIQATGAGTSRIGGLPNNKRCDQCNLYPQRDPIYHAKIAETPSEDNVFDVTVAEDALNSTFCALIQEDKTEYIEDWEDLVEVICGMVDTVCESEGAHEQDPISRSDRLIDTCLSKMDAKMTSCTDLAVTKAAASIKDFVDNFRRERQEFEKSLHHISTINRLLEVFATRPITEEHEQKGAGLVVMDLIGDKGAEVGKSISDAL